MIGVHSSGTEVVPFPEGFLKTILRASAENDAKLRLYFSDNKGV